MKTRILLLFFLTIMSGALFAQGNKKNKSKELPRSEDYKLTISNSVLQLFHPTTSVFAIGLEGKAANGIAFYTEYGLPLKSFSYNFLNEGKLNWNYYKYRLGARYYFDPINPYKRVRRHREWRQKKYTNFVGLEFMSSTQSFDREDGSYWVDNQMVNYSRARVIIINRQFMLIYGREFLIGERVSIGVNLGLGQRIVDVSHESVLVESSPSGFTFFNFSTGEENREGVRALPHFKIGVNLGFRTFKR